MFWVGSGAALGGAGPSCSLSNLQCVVACTRTAESRYFQRGAHLEAIGRIGLRLALGGDLVILLVSPMSISSALVYNTEYFLGVISYSRLFKYTQHTAGLTENNCAPHLPRLALPQPQKIILFNFSYL